MNNNSELELNKNMLLDTLVSFQLYLNDKGLITNHDWEYEKLSKQFIKKEFKSVCQCCGHKTVDYFTIKCSKCGTCTTTKNKLVIPAVSVSLPTCKCGNVMELRTATFRCQKCGIVWLE